MVNKLRKFNGKEYGLLIDEMSYNHAQKYARHIRKQGYHARVVKGKGNAWWSIYLRS